MSETDRKQAQGKPSLRSFNAYVDENGQNLGQDDPLAVGRPDSLRRQLDENPGGEAETARLASDRQRQDSLHGGSIATSEATAAESAPGTVERLGDATLSKNRQGGERHGKKG